MCSSDLRAGLALAAALPELPYACGLGTVSLMRADVLREPLRPVGGMLELRDAVPDPELLPRHAVPASSSTSASSSAPKKARRQASRRARGCAGTPA